MKTAVVILNWNGAALLRRYLPSVTAGTDPDEATVIVADNGSTDNSLALLAEEFPDVEVLSFSENYGFAEGYNRAIELLSARFEYIVLLNSDVAVTPGWTKPLTEYLDSHPQCAAVRSKVYMECGGLDKDFFAHMEEIDLCWRMRLAGWTLAVVPQSVVYHLGGGSLPAENPRKTYLNFRNNLLMLHKNLPDRTRRATLLRRRLLDTIAWARYAATFDFKNAAAIWRAHRDFARMRHNYDSMPRPDSDLIKDAPDILLQFYLRGKKKFSLL